MAKYFKSRLIYFHEPELVKIKPESEISCHNTLTSVISGLFHTRYLHYCSFNPVEQGEELGTPEEGSCKTRKLKSLACCYNYRGNKLAGEKTA